MQQPDVSGLDAAGLIKVIEDAQTRLDEIHSLNSIELKCPQCGQEDALRLEAYHWFDWSQDGAALDINEDPAWGAECACNCPECEYSGHVLDYLPRVKATERLSQNQQAREYSNTPT